MKVSFKDCDVSWFDCKNSQDDNTITSKVFAETSDSYVVKYDNEFGLVLKTKTKKEKTKVYKYYHNHGGYLRFEKIDDDTYECALKDMSPLILRNNGYHWEVASDNNDIESDCCDTKKQAVKKYLELVDGYNKFLNAIDYSFIYP